MSKLSFSQRHHKLEATPWKFLQRHYRLLLRRSSPRIQPVNPQQIGGGVGRDQGNGGGDEGVGGARAALVEAPPVGVEGEVEGALKMEGGVGAGARINRGNARLRFVLYRLERHASICAWH